MARMSNSYPRSTQAYSVEKSDKLQLYFLSLMIVAQPVLDIIAFWFFRFSVPNYAAFLRGLLILIGLVISIKSKVLKKVDYYYIATLSIFLIASILVKHKHVDSFSVTQELMAASKLYSFPIVFILIYRITANKEDHAFTLQLRSLNWSALIILAVYVIAIITGTDKPSYNQGGILTGINGWFHSPNQQSIILVVLLSYFIMFHLLTTKRFIGLLVYLVSWILLNLHGSRTAWAGSIAISLLFLFVLLMNAKQVKITKYRLLLAALIIIGVVFSAFFKQILPVNKPYLTRDYQIKKRLTASKDSDSQKSNMGKLSTESQEPVFTETEDAFLDRYLVGGEKGRLKLILETSTPGAIIRAKEIYLDFAQRMKESPVSKQIDNRHRDIHFVGAAMNKSPLIVKLFGISHQYVSRLSGDIETDYYFIYASFGVFGMLLFFGFPLITLVYTIRYMKWKKVLLLLNMRFLIPAFSVMFMMVAAHFVGRSFQQPSVSFYLALSLSMFLLHFQAVFENKAVLSD